MAGIPISEVARQARVTSRTLRHYDEIGLLHPASIGANGHRYYEREQLLRLQRILLLRELGMGLEVIGQVLAGDRDEVAALRHHHALRALRRGPREDAGLDAGAVRGRRGAVRRARRPHARGVAGR